MVRALLRYSSFVLMVGFISSMKMASRVSKWASPRAEVFRRFIHSNERMEVQSSKCFRTGAEGRVCSLKRVRRCLNLVHCPTLNFLPNFCFQQRHFLFQFPRSHNYFHWCITFMECARIVLCWFSSVLNKNHLFGTNHLHAQLLYEWILVAHSLPLGSVLLWLTQWFL